MHEKPALLMVLLCAAFSAAQTSISGNLDGKTLDSTGNPYTVEADIIVSKAKTLIINEGCVLLFKPFTGLTVKGDLSVTGTPAHPVVFTSINDSLYNKASTQAANAFDWNGIMVSWEAGSVTFKSPCVRYSTYGIKSQKPDITITQGIFKQNGQFHLTIKDKIMPVPETEPYSYAGEQPKPTVVLVPAATRPPISHTKKIVRYSLLGVGIVGTGLGIVLSVNANSAHSNWMHIENEVNPLPPPGEYARRQSKFNGLFAGAIITDILGGGGLIGFGATFVF
jgi:hypothetical protein